MSDFQKEKQGIYRILLAYLSKKRYTVDEKSFACKYPL